MALPPKSNTGSPLYHRHSSRYYETIEKRIEAIAKAEPVTADPAIVESHAMQVAALVAQLKPLRKSIKEYDKAIAKGSVFLTVKI